MNSSSPHTKKSTTSVLAVETMLRNARLEERETEYTLLLNLSDAHTRMGQWEDCIEVLESALPIARDLEDFSGEAMALMRLGDASRASGNSLGAMRHYTNAASLYRELGNKRAEARAMAAIGDVHYCHGNWRDAAHTFTLTMRLLVEIGDERYQGTVLTILGETHRHLQEYDSSLDFLYRALPLHKRFGDYHYAALSYAALGNVYDETGRQLESLKCFKRASELFHRLNDRRNTAVMLVRQSTLLKGQGFDQEASEILEAARAIFNKLADPTADLLEEQLLYWRRPLKPAHNAGSPLMPHIEELPLTAFSFETITFNERGKVKKRTTQSARQYSEELAPGILLEMVEIPGGTFTMGAPGTEECSLKCEGPRHEVTLTSFFIGKFTITQAQWNLVAGWPRVRRRLDPMPSRFKGDDRPVERVSWYHAFEFCERLTKQTGRIYRLPTEAEWEMACRAGTITPFAFGETITHETANYYSEYPYAGAPKHDPRNKTISSGSLGIANAYGIFDMHGNTREWCQDWYGDYTDAPQVNPVGPTKGNCRVLRGGSWYSNAYSCRSASRIGHPPDLRSDAVSFRVVLVVANE